MYNILFVYVRNYLLINLFLLVNCQYFFKTKTITLHHQNAPFLHRKSNTRNENNMIANTHTALFFHQSRINKPFPHHIPICKKFINQRGAPRIDANQRVIIANVNHSIRDETKPYRCKEVVVML